MDCATFSSTLDLFEPSVCCISLETCAALFADCLSACINVFFGLSVGRDTEICPTLFVQVEVETTLATEA